MKAIDRYILEKFQITKDSKYEDPYTCHPKDKFELRQILKSRIVKNPNDDLNDIDVSNITDMGYDGFENNTGLFQSLNPCNIDISKWDMGNVTDTRGMFYDCVNFNCDLSEWDMSNVTNMSSMFSGCENFKGEGLENWNIESCKNTLFAFFGCKSIDRYPSWYDG